MRYAITDIHGCAKTFLALLNTINFSKEDELYLLGDYIDRGPDSRGVIDTIWELEESGHTVFALQGNHEESMLKARHDLKTRRNWMIYGGGETMDSFRAFDFNEIDQKYWDWMEKLPSYLILDDYFLVHAGINFDIPDPMIDKKSMRWIRNWYDNINLNFLDGKIVVHGHTPMHRQEIKNQAAILRSGYKDRPYIDIDNGCVFQDRNKHQLCAFNMDEKTVVFEPYCG